MLEVCVVVFLLYLFYLFFLVLSTLSVLLLTSCQGNKVLIIAVKCGMLNPFMINRISTCRYAPFLRHLATGVFIPSSFAAATSVICAEPTRNFEGIFTFL